MGAIDVLAPNDGCGSQYQHKLYGFLFAQAHHLRFVDFPMHSQFHSDQHTGGLFLENFTGLERFRSSAQQTEQFFGTRTRERIAPLVEWITKPENLPVYFTDSARAGLRSSVMGSILPGESCPYDVAIHIRLGDLDPQNLDQLPSTRLRLKDQRMQRYMPLQPFYVNVLRSVLSQCSASTTVGIYSEGNLARFSALTDVLSNAEVKRVSFELDEDPALAFKAFVTARYLVTSLSTFSHTAGILRAGMSTFYPQHNFTGSKAGQRAMQHRYSPMPGWMQLTNEGLGFACEGL